MSILKISSITAVLSFLLAIPDSVIHNARNISELSNYGKSCVYVMIASVTVIVLIQIRGFINRNK